MNDENVIGYGAVIVPDLDEYQGFFIRKDPELNQAAVMAMMMAVSTGQAVGALQAAIVEGVILKSWPTVAASALALHSITKQPYFIILARKVPGGTHTDAKPIEATNVEDARRIIEVHPEVVAIKARLAIKMDGPKH